MLECAVGVYPVGINTTRTVHLFTRSGTDNRRVQKEADRGHTQKCHTTPEGPRSLHAATPWWQRPAGLVSLALSSILGTAILQFLQERWSRIFTVFDNGQSNIVSRRPRRLAYGRRIRCMRRTVIGILASEGPSGTANIITVRRKHARYRVPTVWTRASGRIQTATFKQKIYRFFENSQ